MSKLWRISRLSLYHPPKPQYQTAELLDYIEAGVDAVSAAYPSATIVLAGDFNTLDDTEVATRGALLSIVDRPTRGTNMLDRVYVNNPCYTAVRVVDSAVKSDHKAITAYAGQVHIPLLNKRSYRRFFRRRSRVTRPTCEIYRVRNNAEYKARR